MKGAIKNGNKGEKEGRKEKIFNEQLLHERYLPSLIIKEMHNKITNTISTARLVPIKLFHNE